MKVIFNEAFSERLAPPPNLIGPIGACSSPASTPVDHVFLSEPLLTMGLWLACSHARIRVATMA